MSSVKCKNCEHATWRGGKTLPGDCTAPIPEQPRVLSLFYAPPTRAEIWSETSGECALYRRRAGSPGAVAAKPVDLGVWAGLAKQGVEFRSHVEGARATVDKDGLPKGFRP